MAVLAPISGLPRFRNGKIVTDAVAYFYNAGTTTPRTVYQNAGGTPHANPVEVLGDGNFPAIYVSGSTAYKVRLEDGDGVLLQEYDDLSGDVEVIDSGGGGTTIPTGAEMVMFNTGIVAGWVRENGRTLGSAASGATERANADAEALFLHLWATDATLTVSGGRGASAAADWAANKTIALPDARGRVLVGLDDMGNTAASRLAGVTFGAGNATTIGATGGAPTHALATGELAAHTHTGTAQSGGSHQHDGTTNSDGAHTHTYDRLGEVNATAQAGAGQVIEAGTNASASTGSSGAHTHYFVTNANGAHTHTLSIDSAGSGTAHNNMQPFALRGIYLKL